MCELTILVPFQITAFLIVAAIVAASVGGCYRVVTFAMNSIRIVLLPLPPDVSAICNSRGCSSPATRGLKEVVDTLHDRGKYKYLPGENPGVYCDEHQPRLTDQHPRLRVLGTHYSGSPWLQAFLWQSFVRNK
jgi:hypothetical protein